MYALILRRLKINGENYYQMIDKVEAKEISEGFIRVIKGYHNFEGQDIVSIDNKDNEIVYLEIDDFLNEKVDGNGTAFFKHDIDGDLEPIEDVVERNNVILAFYDKYKDFKIIPDYDIAKFIDNIETNMKKSVLGQDDAIKKISNKLYHNQMYFKSDLDISIMQKNKSNILIMGPLGTGKTSLKNALLESSSTIPIIEGELSDNYLNDAVEIINSLINAANGNLYLAQRGIVVIDNINSFSSKFSSDEDGMEDENLYLKSLEKLIKSTKMYFPTKNDEILTFDFSLVTFVCFVDTYYKEEEIDTESAYYEKMDSCDYEDLGLTDNFLITCFDNEIIYMNEMTPSLALKILKDKRLSPLYQYKKTLEDSGKTMRVSKKFVDILIEKGLETDEGFEGIKRFFKYTVQAKDRNLKNIMFKDTDIENLRIGSASFDMNEEFNFKPSKDKALDVDVKKRTINGLRVKDAVDLITKEIKGQDEQIFKIVNAFYNHTLNQYKGFNDDEFRKLKQNVFLIASTGVGKTGIFEALAKIFNLPFKRDSINSYTASGYVGKSVDDLITGLISSANGDIDKAQFGILGLDEFDKLARDKDGIGFGRKVQEELLTLIEGDVRDIQTDMSYNSFKFNTEYLFIVLMGACQDIDKVVDNRIKKSRKMGFTGNLDDNTISRDVTREDLLAYGFEDQILARIPNIIRLNDLSKEVLLEIIKSEMGYVNLIRKSYLKSGIKINMTDAFMDNLASCAFDLKIGARGIRQLFEKIIAEIDKNIQNGDVAIVNIGDNALQDFNDITYIERKVKIKIKSNLKK